MNSVIQKKADYYKYKRLAALWLVATITSASTGVYQAIPEREGNSIDNIYEQLVQMEQPSTESTDFDTTDSATSDTDEEDAMVNQEEEEFTITPTELSGGKVLFNKEEEIFIPKAVTSTETSNATEVDNWTTDPFALTQDDPFEIDTQPQSEAQTKTQTKTQTTNETSTSKKQEVKPSSSNKNTQSQATSEDQLLVPIKNSLLDKLYTEQEKITVTSTHTPQVNNPRQDGFFIDANTGEYNTTDQYITYIPDAKTKEEALEELGIYDTKKIESLNAIPLEGNFKSAALQLSKTDVYARYESLNKAATNYRVVYSNEANAIYLCLKGGSIGENINLIDIIGTIREYQIYNKGTAEILSKYALSDELGGVQAVVSVVEGYNGNLQCILDGIPYVILLEPSEEPYLSDASLRGYKSLIAPKPEQILNPHYEEHSHSHEHTEWDEDSFWGQADEDYEEQTENIIPNDIDYTLPTVPEVEEEPIYTSPESTWGKTHSDVSGWLDNVTDGSELESYEGAVLDVIDVDGNQVDLVEETQKQQPAAIQAYTPIRVEPEPMDDNSIFIITLCFIATLICLVAYCHYLKLFKQEYLKELETAGIIDNISASEVVDYAELNEQEVEDIFSSK